MKAKDRCAKRGRKLAEYYFKKLHPDVLEHDYLNLAQILADLKHYADAQEINFYEALRVAQNYYLAERNGEDDV